MALALLRFGFGGFAGPGKEGGEGTMLTGPLGDSAGPPQEPSPPSRDGRRHSWLVKGGWHPVTWAAVGLVLLGTGGLAVLLHQPGGRARAQNVYCGLVTCAVLRSVAAKSGDPAAHPGVAAPSPLATSRTPTPSPAHLPSPQPAGARAAASAPSPAPTPTPASRPSPRPSPASPPGPPRWPWPFPWPPHPWGTGEHPGSDFGHGF
jgi:hypothetical protein